MGKELHRVHSLCLIRVFCLFVTVPLFLPFLHFADLLHQVGLLRGNPVRHVRHHELEGYHVNFVKDVIYVPSGFCGNLPHYAVDAMGRFRMSLL